MLSESEARELPHFVANICLDWQSRYYIAIISIYRDTIFCHTLYYTKVQTMVIGTVIVIQEFDKP